jgi:hypothetical protein
VELQNFLVEFFVSHFLVLFRVNFPQLLKRKDERRREKDSPLRRMNKAEANENLHKAKLNTTQGSERKLRNLPFERLERALRGVENREVSNRDARKLSDQHDRRFFRRIIAKNRNDDERMSD